jgi:flagellar hook-associated protein 2
MGRIQSTIGLITGLPIQDTVDQLMKIEARPRDLVVSRTKALQAQQTAVTELTAKVLAVQFAARRLGNASVFDKKTATSSAPDFLAVAVTGQPPAGNYQITPVQTAQSHQLLSSGFASRTEPLGAGQFSFRYGRTVNDGLALSDLNGGNGVERGKIRITDRSGASSVVDLRFAQTVDDVIQAINSTDGVNVTASVVGDRIQLVDETGQTATNLKVQEVNGGQTAADLGLAGIDVAANQAQGSDVLRLHQGLALATLNDGAGVDLSDTLSDLEVNLRDGTTLSIDFHRLARPEDFAHATTSAAGGENARVTLTAKQKGAAHDDVQIVFVDDAGVTQGNETVVYDDSDPDNKTLTVHIDAGQTTAADVAAAITGDATAGALFTAAAEGDGQGVVDVNDTAVTLGGGALAARKEATLGDLIATINEVDPTRLRAELSPDGDRLILTDLSADAGGVFEVVNPLDHRTAEHLGLARSASGGVITGSRLLGGLKTSLLSSLNGGRGLALGQLNLTDRSGASDTVDLSSAETLEDVINTINAAGVSVTAAINSARTGLVLTDASGGSGDLTIADGDATNTAQKLQIAVDDAVSTVNSGSLDLQVISRQTTLDSLNGGKGVTSGSFLIFNSNGLAKTFNPGTANLKTVGDLIDKINDASLGIKARINDAGDGIALIDTVGGAQSLRVQEVGSGTVARDLHLLGTGTGATENGNPAQIIQGSTTTTITIDDDDTLNDLVAKINNSGGAVAASVFSSGSGSLPHRLSLLSSTPGLAGRLVVDASAAGFELNETAAARDALLVYGSSSNGAGVLVSSSQDTFSSLIDGLSVTVKGGAANPVTVSVASTDSDVVGAVKTFIEQYNALQTKLEEATFFNETDQSVGVLFGSHETLRIENDLANLVTGRFFGAGSIQSLAEVGIQVGDDGKLQLDETKLKAKFAADPQGVEEFFAKEDLGVADKFDRLIETLAGANSSLLVDRAGALAVKIELGLSRVDFLNERLTRERERMLKQFYDMETAIGKLQNNLTALNQLQVLPPLTSVR